MHFAVPANVSHEREKRNYPRDGAGRVYAITALETGRGCTPEAGTARMPPSCTQSARAQGQSVRDAGLAAKRDRSSLLTRLASRQ